MTALLLQLHLFPARSRHCHLPAPCGLLLLLLLLLSAAPGQCQPCLLLVSWTENRRPSICIRRNPSTAQTVSTCSASQPPGPLLSAGAIPDAQRCFHQPCFDEQAFCSLDRCPPRPHRRSPTHSGIASLPRRYPPTSAATQSILEPPLARPARSRPHQCTNIDVSACPPQQADPGRCSVPQPPAFVSQQHPWALSSRSASPVHGLRACSKEKSWMSRRKRRQREQF